jgi:hypothetical protein
VGIEQGTEGDEPGGHGHAVEEEQGGQIGVGEATVCLGGRGRVGVHGRSRCSIPRIHGGK